MRLLAKAASAAVFLMLASAATALPVVISPCDRTLTTPDAIGCAGYYAGNLLNGSPADVQNQKDAIASLGFSWDGNWSSLVAGGDVITSLTNGNELNFGRLLSGTTIIGAHFGNVQGPAGNVSVFWLLDLAGPTDHVSLDFPQGWSNAALYTTAPVVPEPATWAMMIGGFALIGLAIRRRPRRSHPHQPGSEIETAEFCSRVG